MAADPVVYCLTEITDYAQFERFAHDVLVANGYPRIEPLGGFKDKGRDAVHRSIDGEVTTIFAYSVREDWRKKLDEDASKIAAHGHACTRLVFLSTAIFTASERDSAVADIKAQFGWELELYGIERLRVLLVGPCRHVIAAHPQIFTPVFFHQAGGLTVVEARDHLVIDHAGIDEPLASWLTRRLRLAGYKVWSRSLAPIAGTSAGETVETLLKYRAVIYLPILSPAAIADTDLSDRRVIAANALGTNVIPIVAAAIDKDRLDRKTRDVEHVDFATGWAEGLVRLGSAISTRGLQRASSETRIVLDSLMPREIVEYEPERVISNRFRVMSAPTTVRGYTFSRIVEKDKMQALKRAWPCRRVNDYRYLSFQSPPKDVVSSYGVIERGGAVWNAVKDVEGIRSDHLVSELLRRSVEKHFVTKGLAVCEHKGNMYFPAALCKSDRLYLTHPDGSRTYFAVHGERTLYRPMNRSTKYKYYLSPSLAVKMSEGDLMVELRVRARITDEHANLYTGRAVISRRKHLCNSWYNDEWLIRVAGLMQFVASDGTDEIVIPIEGDKPIVVSAKPEEWTVPVRIVKAAVAKAKKLAQEAALYTWGDEDDDQGLEEAASLGTIANSVNATKEVGDNNG